MNADAVASWGYGLRKRRRAVVDSGPSPLERLEKVASEAKNIVIFSGSGLSANCGMSTFSTPGGLYERASRRHRLSDGKSLFTYQWYDRNRLDAGAFFADVHGEAVGARPGAGHAAVQSLERTGRLLRHYTMNVDGLAQEAGCSIWAPSEACDGEGQAEERECRGKREGKDGDGDLVGQGLPSAGSPGRGSTVELHGTVRELVCIECESTAAPTSERLGQLRSRTECPCPACSHPLRFKMMLYEDADSELITDPSVIDLMDEDFSQADLIVWVGISFQQSASTAYFRQARRALADAGRQDACVHAVINPSPESLWNLVTASSNAGDLSILQVLDSGDDALVRIARCLDDRARATAPPAPGAALGPPADDLAPAPATSPPPMGVPVPTSHLWLSKTSADSSATSATGLDTVEGPGDAGLEGGCPAASSAGSQPEPEPEPSAVCVPADLPPTLPSPSVSSRPLDVDPFSRGHPTSTRTPRPRISPGALAGLLSRHPAVVSARLRAPPSPSLSGQAGGP